MITRNLLYAITLIAYTLSLVHSVIPHHHHKSAEEATAHQHADVDHHHATHDHHPTTNHHHQHNEDAPEDSQSQESETGHFFFFNHDLNVDVIARHSSIDNPVKVEAKKSQTVVLSTEQIISFEVTRHLVFHPPQDDPAFYLTTILPSELRGPPAFLI